MVPFQTGWMTYSGMPARMASQTLSIVNKQFRLVKNGLIERQRSMDDRRRVYLRLTAKGQEVLASGSSPLPPNFIANFDNDLPDWEKNMILCALLKLTHLMRANGGRP